MTVFRRDEFMAWYGLQGFQDAMIVYFPRFNLLLNHPFAFNSVGSLIRVVPHLIIPHV
jgi:hypothetical protein